jgi:hypothetical protein
MKGVAKMVKFEYKVYFMSGINGQYVFDGPVPETKIEDVMNEYAKDGWEYQNTIVNPYVTDGERFLKPSFYLVFRRAKS